MKKNFLFSLFLVAAFHVLMLLLVFAAVNEGPLQQNRTEDSRFVANLPQD